MNLIIGFLLVLLIAVCVLLVIIVLMQRSKSDGLSGGSAFGGSFTESFFGGGAANVLTKITSWLGGIFFGLALLLAILFSLKQRESGDSSLQKILAQKPQQQVAATNGVNKTVAVTNGVKKVAAPIVATNNVQKVVPKPAKK